MKQTEERRKALIVFSDCEENSSEHDLLDAIGSGGRRKRADLYHRYTDAGHRKNVARMENDTAESEDGFDSRLERTQQIRMR